MLLAVLVAEDNISELWGKVYKNMDVFKVKEGKKQIGFSRRAEQCHVKCELQGFVFFLTLLSEHFLNGILCISMYFCLLFFFGLFEIY